MRRFAAFLLLASLAGSAVAQDVTYTTLTVAYGKVRMKDGSYADLKGMKLPAKIERVTSTIMQKPPTPYFESAIRKAPAFAPLALQAFYWADQDPNNTNSLPYGAIDPEFDSCSVLDDIQVAGNTVNVPWQQLTWAMTNPQAHDFLIRWTVWNAYNANAPAGTSAFSPYPVPSNYLLDFGIKWPATQTQTGPIKVTINIAAAQVYAPQSQFWFSQQFRQWQFPGNPDAPFDNSVGNLFNHLLPPQVGFSDVFFWLDGPEGDSDGMYEEQEKDIFGDTQNPQQGNLMLKIEGNLSGTIQDCNPTAAILEKGGYISGDFTDLWFSDDFYYKAKPDWTQPRSVEPLQLTVEGRSPSANINSISFSCESGTTGGNATQKIQMYRFGGPTPGWVDVDTRAIATADGNVTYIYTGANPQYFINTADQNRLRARVKITPDGSVARGFNVRFDRCRWQVSTP